MLQDGENATSEETTLADLRPGAIFVTRDGVRAVKSEYHYSNDLHAQCLCILLSSGEFAHFRNGNRTRVREVRCIEPFHEPLGGMSGM